jgi:hypothetical protein
MGAAARHRRDFLKVHSFCAFCGGKAKATTVEHCPPRAMFQFRQWPVGFEFPSCEGCNRDSRYQDLLVAMLARMDPFEEKGDKDGKQVSLMETANKRFPGLFEKMMPSATEARRYNREIGLKPMPGQTHQEAGLVNVPAEFHNAICVFARKLAKGIFYREIGSPFPNNGCLLLNWFTNVDLIRGGKYIMFDILKELGGIAPPLQRSGKYLNDQFEYKLSLSQEKDIMVLQAKFGNSFGLIVFGSPLQGRLETVVARLREKTQRNGPFAILQSPTLT